MTSYEGLVDDKVALDQLLFFGMVDEFASGEARRLVCFCPLAAGHGHAVRQFGHPDLAN